ncbi:MAG: hypothetical protein KAS75_08065 [Planctomycetes bacterium]|nr:hypothetical protein [Planctomycetota bacterium]
MKKITLLAVIILLSISGLVQAEPGELSGSLNVTYLSSYIWRGFDYYADDRSAIQGSINLDLYGTGFDLGILSRRAISNDYENAENLNVTLSYSNSVSSGDITTNYTVGWVYYGFPDEPRDGTTIGQAADMQEFFAAFSWPDVCPFGVVPSYTILTMWPSEGDSAGNKNAGWAHVLGLGYDLAVPGFVPGTTEQILHLSAAAVYNDGVAPGVVVNTGSGSIDHDWSHAVFGVSTNFELGNNLSLTPGVYYQSSWEDTVNKEDECWVSVGMTYILP